MFILCTHSHSPYQRGMQMRGGETRAAVLDSVVQAARQPRHLKSGRDCSQLAGKYDVDIDLMMQHSDDGWACPDFVQCSCIPTTDPPCGQEDFRSWSSGRLLGIFHSVEKKEHTGKRDRYTQDIITS